MKEEAKPKLSASQSFTEDEIEWLHQLFVTLLRGGDAKVLMSNRKIHASWLRKAIAMKRRLGQLRAEHRLQSKG